MTTTNMPAPTSPELDRFITLLREMFQLDKPELDFGLYRIMHAKARQISRFMEEDLIQIVRNAFGEVDAANLKEAQAAYETAVEQAKKYGAPDPEATEGAIEAKKALQQVRDGGRAETDIYDHLYRFFERYYDKGDFMSRRYYARESDSRAAPYAVPYDGREVYLHWANKDQYYIKSSEYLTNFRFDAQQALEQGQYARKDAAHQAAMHYGVPEDVQPLPVRFTIAGAAEGEHNNVKAAADAKRQFIPYLDNPAAMEDGVLVLNFEYKPLPDGYPFNEADIKAKYGAINKGQMPENWMADVFLEGIAGLGEAAKPWQQVLAALAPTEKQKKRTLLAKYIEKYTARNTMDYFIHKDLGRFLRRELDFYIKNEIMQLDNIERADAPAVESWLARIKVIREIGHRIIAMLAQLEDFQKKLWLKKKFVTETNYCITLDRVPEELYPELIDQAERMVLSPKGDKRCQRGEWVDLLAIDKVEGYSEPLTTDFMQRNPNLVLDTAFFDADFKARLFAAIPDLDAQCDGMLINADNNSAITLTLNKYKHTIESIITDPPYNTGNDGFIYRDGYADSSWMCQVASTISLTSKLIKRGGCISLHIGDKNNKWRESTNLIKVMDYVLGNENYIAQLVWKNKSGGGNDSEFFAQDHEYIVVYSTDRDHATVFHDPNAEVTTSYNHQDRLGRYSLDRLDKQSIRYSKSGDFPIIGPDGNEYWPAHKDPEHPNATWRWSEKKVKNDYDQLVFQAGHIYTKNYEKDGAVPRSLLTSDRFGRTRTGKTELFHLFGRTVFDNPKPTKIESFLVSVTSSVGSLIFDPYGGSGATARAVIGMTRRGNHRKYFLVEMGGHFDRVLIPGVVKVAYCEDWKDGKPTARDTGISHCFKYIRLESYEDTLNNLVLEENTTRDKALDANPELRREYLLHYFLDTETKGSQSLLNVAEFRDPTAYKLKVKAPGSDVQVEKTVDLVETFNWLIGLWVEHLAAPQTLRAEFTREKDPELPEDEATRLVCAKLRPDGEGDYWFRTVEGYVLKTPGDTNSKSPVLVIWRKLTDDPERDNAALQKYLEIIKVSTREKVYDTIYVNGSHTLPNPVVDGETTRVQLLEEAFHRAMWAGAEA